MCTAKEDDKMIKLGVHEDSKNRDKLVELLRGGTSVGQGTLTRFYSLHTFVLPLITAVLMLAHFLMIRKQGISGPL